MAYNVGYTDVSGYNTGYTGAYTGGPEISAADDAVEAQSATVTLANYVADPTALRLGGNVVAFTFNAGVLTYTPPLLPNNPALGIEVDVDGYTLSDTIAYTNTFDLTHTPATIHDDSILPNTSFGTTQLVELKVITDANASVLAVDWPGYDANNFASAVADFITPVSDTAASTDVTMGYHITETGATGTFTRTLSVPEAVVDQFTFTDIANQPLSTQVESDVITVTGISDVDEVAITVTGGEYAKSTDNGATFGAWTSAEGTVRLNDQIKVRHTTSGTNSTGVNTVLSIVNVSDTFTSTTTTSADTTPAQFTFTDVTNQAISAVVESNAITVTDVTSGTNIPISVTGGEYAVSTDGGSTFGAWQTVSGNVQLSNQVKVRHTTSASNSTAVTTTLDIGGVTDGFSTTTEQAIDITPAQFTFTDISNQQINAVVETNAITVNGVDAGQNIPVSVTGGEYSVSTDGGATFGAWTSANTTVQLNYQIKVRHTTSGSYNSNKSTTLDVGGITDTFTSSTSVADIVPNQFTFTDVTDQSVNSLVESNAITLTGVASGQAIPVTISGGEYAKSTDGGSTFAAWTSAAGTMQLNDQVKVRHTTSASYSATNATTLDIGGVTDVFSTTTQAPDTQAPVITLNAGTDTITEGGTWTDAGATVTDNVDATTTIYGVGSVDTNTPGTYSVTYNYTDAGGNPAVQVTRTVTVEVLIPSGIGPGRDNVINPGETFVITSTITTLGAGETLMAFITVAGTRYYLTVTDWAAGEITVTAPGNLPVSASPELTVHKISLIAA